MIKGLLDWVLALIGLKKPDLVVKDIFHALNKIGIKYNDYDKSNIEKYEKNVKTIFMFWLDRGCATCGRRSPVTEINYWLESKKGFWNNAYDIFVICQKCKDERE